MTTLPTWVPRNNKTFSYEGSVKSGTRIVFGESKSVRNVSSAQYADLLNQFSGRSVKLGAARDNQPTNSLGSWLMANVTRTAIASYVGPILVTEGYAEKAGSNIRFF